uniref:CAZy families GH13 protein n=1 Tax=uncultured Leptotrichia sp. TaxID=159271 RepID=A0A060CF07_9FUSO|nr:CAZy families GH13 protein [uncultured Leptotrichia sp.]
MLQGFSWILPADGQHWKHLADLAPELGRMGITAIWLPPAYKSVDGAKGVGYGAYDLWDLGEFDQCGSVRTKYGYERRLSFCD